MEYAFDRVRFELSVRQTVPTETVRLHVEAIVGVNHAQADAAPELIHSTLMEVLPADWIVGLTSKREDKADVDLEHMEHLVLRASARVPEAKTASLSERLRKASRSGLSLRLRHIEFRTPLKQIDEVSEKLRAEVYRLAQQEVDTLNKALPSDTLPWRIGSITITSIVEKPEQTTSRPGERSQHGSSAREFGLLPGEETSEEAASEALVNGIRVSLRGDVVLHRLSVLPPEFRRASSDSAGPRDVPLPGKDTAS